MNEKQGRSIGDLLRRAKDFKEFTITLIIVLLIIGIAANSPIFLSASNIRTTAIGLSCYGIVAIGMTIALISGGFDLSVGSVMGLTSVFTVIIAGKGVNIWLAAAAALAIGLMIGALNGVLIGKCGLNAFITTLGIQQIARGAVFVLTKGGSIRLRPGTDVELFQVIGKGSVFGIPIIVIIFVVLAIVGDFLVKRTSAAMKVFYIGSNEKAAILSGINTQRVKIVVYTLTAGLAAFAGVLTAARFGVATSNTGAGTEMIVISAAVIGGASLSGGKGTILGAVLGVVMLNIINNALVLFNVSVYWQSFISGVILICAILIDQITSRTKRKA